MIISIPVAKKKATDIVTYELLANKLHTGEIFSYSIVKVRNYPDKREIEHVARGIKSKSAIDLIWADIEKGEQR